MCWLPLFVHLSCRWFVRYDGYLAPTVAQHTRLLALIKLYNKLPVHFLWETLPMVRVLPFLLLGVTNAHLVTSPHLLLLVAHIFMWEIVVLTCPRWS
jgi:hypothetical protein